MNLKTLTALVGSLSLGSLAAGCATTPKMGPAPTSEEAHQGSHDGAPGTAPGTHGASPVPTEQQGDKPQAPQSSTQAAPGMNVTPAKAPAGQPAQATPAVEKTTEHKCGTGGCGAGGCGKK